MNLSREIAKIISRRINTGCYDHGCRIKKPTGQAPNAGCHCADLTAGEIENWLANNRDFAVEEINFSRKYLEENNGLM